MSSREAAVKLCFLQQVGGLLCYGSGEWVLHRNAVSGAPSLQRLHECRARESAWEEDLRWGGWVVSKAQDPCWCARVGCGQERLPGIGDLFMECGQWEACASGLMTLGTPHLPGWSYVSWLGFPVRTLKNLY